MKTTKRRGHLGIIDEAIEIQGYLPVPGPRETTYRITEITGRAPNGAWITTHPTANLCGVVKIKKSAHAYLVRVARGIIERREEIEARREQDCAAFRAR